MKIQSDEVKDRLLFPALAALGSVAAACSCCLPLGTLWMAAGAAGASAVLPLLRPYLMVLSVALIVFGFWRARRAARCERKPRPLTLALLWFATGVVVLSLLFPQLFASLLAGR